MRNSFPLGLVLAVAFFPAAGCIENHLNVDITAQIHIDGSVSRRTEYRLERFDTEKRQALPLNDPQIDTWRRLHRFPTGDLWSVREESAGEAHFVTTEALLASPNDIDWDFWRAAPKALPARNYVSFHMSSGSYEYSETFMDFASPLAAVRRMAQFLSKKDDEFARGFEEKVGPHRFDRNLVKRAFRDKLASPFLRKVTALSERPIWGPREREQLVALLDANFDEPLKEALQAMNPGMPREDIDSAVKDVSDAFGASLQNDLESAGLSGVKLLPGSGGEDAPELRFRVTLIMPAPITRANTCFQGDTAVWEFTEEDLYGRGFEVWVKAAGS